MLKQRYQLLFLAFVVLGIYYPVIFSPYCSVDDLKMVNGIWNLDDFTVSGLFFPHGSGQYYRPLLYLSFIGDRFAWGLEESFMHLENLLLHLGNALLVFASTRALMKCWKMEGGTWAPLAAALVFALHPINTEPVNWISGRTDLMAGFFVLISLWLLILSLDSGRRLPLLFSGLALLLGSLCKESALFFAPAAGFLVLCHDRRFGAGTPWPARLKRMAPAIAAVVIASLCYLAMRSYAFSASDNGVGAALRQASAPAGDLLKLLRVLCKATGFYVKKLLFPLPLNFAIVKVSDYYVFPGALFLLLLCSLLYRRTLTGFLVFASFIICAPSFLLTVSKMSWTPVAERYLYIPSATFAMLLALGAVSLYRRRELPLLTGSFVLVLCGSAYATATRNIVWQDNYTLFSDTTRKSPGEKTAQNDLAYALAQRGRVEEARKIWKAEDIDNFQIASLNKAMVEMSDGNVEGARKILYDRLKEGSGYQTRILEKLVKIAEQKLADSHDPAEQRALNRELLELITKQYQVTRDPFYQYRLGLVQLRLDRKKTAFSLFSAAKMAAPSNAYYRQPAIRLADKFRPL